MAGSGRRPEHRGPPELVSGGTEGNQAPLGWPLLEVLGLTAPAALSLQFYDEAEARKYTQKYDGTSATGLQGRARPIVGRAGVSSGAGSGGTHRGWGRSVLDPTGSSGGPAARPGRSGPDMWQRRVGREWSAEGQILP